MAIYEGEITRMLFAFTVALVGFSFAVRISERLIARNLFHARELTKIGTAYGLSSVVILTVLPHAHLTLWLSVFSPLAIAAIVSLGLIQRRSAGFRAHIRETLALISLKMKSGRSFRQALAEVTSESDGRVRAKLTEIANVVVFSQQKSDISDSFICEVIAELAQVDRNPHCASRRLAVFREKLRIEDDFRHKSGQVLARIRAQSLIMTGLFLALLAFMSVKFGFKSNGETMLISGLLFGTGAAWIWIGGRRLTWKV